MNSSARANATVVDGRGGRPTLPVLRFILSCALLMIPMGTLLSFGRLKSVLAHYIGHKNHTDPPDVTPVVVCAWVVFPFSVFAFGYLVMKVSYPRMIVFCGCAIGSISLAISSVQTTLAGITFFYGILQGVACGAYVIPLVYITQCFPHTLGVMMGFATSTFAAGELLGNYVFGQLLGLSELPCTTTTDVDYDVFKKVPVMFRVYAMVYFVSTLLGTILLPDPKEVMLRVRLHGVLEVQPQKTNKDEHIGDIQAVVRTARHYQTLIKKKLYVLLLPVMTLTVSACGSLVIENVSQIGLKINNLSEDSVTSAETWATLSGVVGRLVWGIVADAIGYHLAMAVIGILSGSLYFSLTYIKIAGFFQLWTCMMAFTFAGNFATVPTAVTELFGSEKFSIYFPIAYAGIAFGVAISYGQSSNLVSSFDDGTRTTVVTLSFVVGLANLIIFPLRYLRFADPGCSATNSNPTSSKAVSSSGLIQHSSVDISQRNLRSCSSLNSSNDMIPTADPTPLFAPQNRQFSALPETSLTSLPSITNCHRKFSTLPRSPSPSVDSPPPPTQHVGRMPTTISPPQA